MTKFITGAFKNYVVGMCSTVRAKYGNINTDHILFICSGAFHSCKPSDMFVEL